MLIILTGPPASGKNTVAKKMSEYRESCAIIDVDVVRQMLVKPHLAPWKGLEGNRQRMIGAKNACALADNFKQESLDVIILDVLTHDTAKIYREKLSRFSPKIVQLLPHFDTTLQRSKLRREFLQPSEIELIYKQQQTFDEYDFQLDNTSQTVQATAKLVLSRLSF